VAAGNDAMSESEHLKEILAHERIWRRLYDRAKVALDRFSQQEDGGKLGYWIVSDDWGSDFLQIEVTDLRLLRRDAMGALKRVLDDFPGWQIAVRIFALDTEPPLPRMGLLISDGQVFHDLKREYLPEEIRHITYEGI
jgi:hypothetical protein